MPDPVDVEVGRRVRARRRGLDLSQADLARACGITFQQIQKYESGANRVSASRLVQMARVLKTTAAALIGESTAEDGAIAVEARAIFEGYSAIRDPQSRQLVQDLIEKLAPSPLQRAG